MRNLLIESGEVELILDIIFIHLGKVKTANGRDVTRTLIYIKSPEVIDKCNGCLFWIYGFAHILKNTTHLTEELVSP